MTGLRTLPIRIAPLPGESLISWMEASAVYCHVDLREQLIAVGLHTGGPVADHTLYLTHEEAGKVAFATGVAAARLRAMTLEPYIGHVIDVREGRRSVNRAALWGRGRGSRYCPACLAERSGRWMTRWRLSWSFACVRHRALLRDTCPSCGSGMRTGAISVEHTISPHRCPSRPRADDQSGARCGADLSSASAHELAPHSPVLAAQLWIDDQLAHVEAGNHATSRTSFTDLHALAQWIAQYRQPGDFTDLGPGFDASAEDGDWRFAPTSAHAMAAAATRAVQVLRDPKGRDSLEIVRKNLGHQHDTAADNFHPAVVRRRWQDSSPEIQQLMWQAMDSHMSTVDRLRYRSFPGLDRPRALRPSVERRARGIPQLLWPGWGVRLLPPEGVRPRHFRAMMSAALLLPGFNLRRIAPLKRTLGITWKADVSAVLAVLHDGGYDDVLAALCRIADCLDGGGCPIDYERRRRAVGDDLLPADIWHEICRSTGSSVGGGETALRRMRGYLYQRVTGNDYRYAQHKSGVTGPASEARFGSNPFGLTALLLAALDEYASGYLAGKSIREPLLWEPPSELAIGLALPGKDPADIDIHALHRFLGAGAPTGSIAEQLATSPEHIRLAVELFPPGSTGDPALSPSGRRTAASRTVRLTEQFLREQYIALRKPSQAIAEETGYQAAVIQERLRHFGLTLTKTERARIDPDRLRELYLRQGKTFAQIAAEVGCSTPHVGRSLKRLGIEVRSKTGTVTPPPGSPPLLAPALSRWGGMGRLRAFELAMSHATIHDASSVLGIHESGLAQKLRLLEKDFGQPLFMRAFSGAVGQHWPTRFGEQVLKALREIPHERPPLQRATP